MSKLVTTLLPNGPAAGEPANASPVFVRDRMRFYAFLVGFLVGMAWALLLIYFGNHLYLGRYLYRTPVKVVPLEVVPEPESRGRPL